MNNKLPVQIGQLALRYPFCAICLILSVLFVGASWWIRLDLNDLEAQQQKSAREGDIMLKAIARGSQLRTELTAARAATQRITENLVVEKNIPQNFWYFYKLEQDTRVKLLELLQRPPSLQDFDAPTTYKRVPYSLRLTGSFRSAVAYLQRLETGSHFGRINSFLLQRQDPKSSDVSLQLNLDLLGFP